MLGPKITAQLKCEASIGLCPPFFENEPPTILIVDNSKNKPNSPNVSAM